MLNPQCLLCLVQNIQHNFLTWEWSPPRLNNVKKNYTFLTRWLPFMGLWGHSLHFMRQLHKKINRKYGVWSFKEGFQSNFTDWSGKNCCNLRVIWGKFVWFDWFHVWLSEYFILKNMSLYESWDDCDLDDFQLLRWITVLIRWSGWSCTIIRVLGSSNPLWTWVTSMQWGKYCQG